MLEALIVARPRRALFQTRRRAAAKSSSTLAQREGSRASSASAAIRPYRHDAFARLAEDQDQHEQEFVIGGWTEPNGSRAVRCAAARRSTKARSCVYAGQVGTGFIEKLLREIGERLRERERKTSPFATHATRTRPPHFVRTGAGRRGALRRVDARRLSAPAGVLGLRIDKESGEGRRARSRRNRERVRSGTTVRGRKSTRSRSPISTKCCGRATATRRAI